MLFHAIAMKSLPRWCVKYNTENDIENSELQINKELDKCFYTF